MSRKIAALAMGAALSIGAAPPALADKGKAVSGHEELFSLLPKLWQKRPFRKDEVARLTGAELQVDAGASNPFFHLYRSRVASGPLSTTVIAIELREPVEHKPGKDGLILLEVSPKACIKQKDVISHFGTKVEPTPPSPHGPPNTPMYLVYHQEWGDLSFGFATKGAECLASVVIDAISRK